jgi:hypothetical protein
MKTHTRYRTLSFMAGLFALSGAFIATACSHPSSGSDRVSGRGKLVTLSQALAANSLTSMHGSYGADCDLRRSGTWTVTISGSPGADELSVVRDDTNCVLTLTSVMAGSTEYVPASPIVLDGSFETNAVAFHTGEDEDVVAFYANSKLDPADYSEDFDVVFVSSDEVSDVDGGQYSAQVSVASASQASTIEAPNYELSSTIAYSASEENKVTGATGSITLGLPAEGGTYAAQYYRIVDGSSLGVSPSFNQVDDAFVTAGGAGQAMKSSFGWEELGLTNGAALSFQKTIIIQRVETDDASNVVSYQTFWLKFNPPAQ